MSWNSITGYWHKIEEAAGISGTGSAGKLAIWSSASALTYNSGIAADSATGVVTFAYNGGGSAGNWDAGPGAFTVTNTNTVLGTQGWGIRGNAYAAAGIRPRAIGVLGMSTVGISDPPWGIAIGVAGYAWSSDHQVGGFFTTESPSAGFLANGLDGGIIVDNGTTPWPLALFRANSVTKTSILKDGGVKIDSPTIATDGTIPAFNVIATLPAVPSTAVSGINATITSAGSAGQDQRGLSVSLAAGYTGGSASAAIYASNALASVGNTTDVMASAVQGVSTTSAAGWSAGVYGIAANGSGLGSGLVGVGSGAGYTFGVLGIASAGTNARFGGYFSLASPSGYTTAALLADNGSVAAPIILANDNGTTVWGIADGGSIQYGNVKTLTESSATSVVNIVIANSGGAAGVVRYTVFAKDSTNTQLKSGLLYFSFASNSSGTVTAATLSDVNTLNPCTSGTLTNTWTQDSATANTLKLSANAVSSLTQTTLEVRYRVELFGGTATVTPQ